MSEQHMRGWSARHLAIETLLFVVLAFFCSIPTSAVDANHQVLFISSYSYEMESVPEQIRGITDALGNDVSIKYLDMDTKNQSERAAALYLCTRLDRWRLLPTIDAVILGDDAALSFALRYQDEYFSGLPLIFLDVKQATLAKGAASEKMIAGTLEGMPFKETIALAQTLRPKSRQVVCIGDGSDSSRGMLSEFYALGDTFPSLRFGSVNVKEMTRRELRNAMNKFGEETILIYTAMGSDGEGDTYSDLQAAEMLTSLTEQPIFTTNGVSVGSGFLGGCVVSRYDAAFKVGEFVGRVLDGDAMPSDMGHTEMPVITLFDKTQMDRLGITKNKMPNDTQYINDLQTEVLQRYGGILAIGGVTIMALATILMLLMWDNQRHRLLTAQVESRERQLRKLMDLVPGGICSFRVNEGEKLEILHLNAGFYQQLGFTGVVAEGGIVLNLMEQIHPEDREIFWRGMHQLCESSRDLRETLRLRRSDGTYIWMSLQAALAQDENGERIYYGAFSDVDALKRMQASLEESEHTLQAAMEHANVDFWIYDTHQHTRRQSKQAVALRRIPQVMENYPESWLALGITLDEDAHKLRAAVEEINDGAREVTFEVRERFPDGEIYWQLVRMTSLYDAAGNRTSVLCTGSDNTQLHREVERYERQNSQVSAALPNAVASCQVNLTQNSCTPGYCQYPELTLGMDGTLENLLQQMKSRAINHEQAEALAASLSRKALMDDYERGTTTLTLDRCCHINGKARWISIRVDMTRHPITGDLEARFYAFDIDTQKSMEQIMDTVIRREYLMLLRIDMTEDIVRVFSSQGEQNSVHEITHAEEAFLGSVRESYAGDDLDDILYSLSFKEIRRQLDANNEYTLYVNCYNSGGDVRRLRYAFSWLDRQNGTVCCAMTDVTDAFKQERHRNETLQAALEDARAASRAKSDFLSRISHEIRTPMNAILGLTGLMCGDTDNPETLDNLEKIQTSGEYLLGLINDVLDMSRIESGRMELHPENTDIRGFFKKLQQIIGPRMEDKHIRFRLDIGGEETPYLVLDQLRMQQVYINLLNNAVKFSEPGTEIACVVTHVPYDEARIAATIVIRDQGCGMTEEFLERAFEPFEQGKNPYQTPQFGTGLGLAIVKNLVELQGGKIEVKSELGRGSEFTVKLLFQRGQRPDGPELNAGTERVSLKGRRVLLAEDHPINTEIAKKILTRAGMLVDHAENGEVAVQKYLGAEEGYYDAILMDIRMPVMNGLDATKIIRLSPRPDARSIPIIAMTANAFQTDHQATKAAGMNVHLSKPVDAEELLDTLRRFIRPL